MTRYPKLLVRKLLNAAGYDLIPRQKVEARLLVPELTDAEAAIMEKVRPFTMSSIERLWSTTQAARYAAERKLEGDFVECGVWRGGSSMAAALTFVALGDTSRTMWLFDTFDGMTEPLDVDVTMMGGIGATEIYNDAKTDTGSTWANAQLDEVRANMASTGYPADRLRYVKGPVEQTMILPENQPEKVAVLRLDTDWYESTKVEMEVLFDRIVPGGLLIVDDYGHWAGSKKAVDEFLAARPERYLLHRIDHTGRALIKA